MFTLVTSAKTGESRGLFPSPSSPLALELLVVGLFVLRKAMSRLFV